MSMSEMERALVVLRKTEERAREANRARLGRGILFVEGC
jgi:hypothetical protein